jgi:hypothetical protein
MHRVTVRLSQKLTNPSPTENGSSFGSKLARGIVYGGLAGGLIGLGIELSPPEMGLKDKADAWFNLGAERFRSLRNKLQPISNSTRLNSNSPELDSPNSEQSMAPIPPLTEREPEQIDKRVVNIEAEPKEPEEAIFSETSSDVLESEEIRVPEKHSLQSEVPPVEEKNEFAVQTDETVRPSEVDSLLEEVSRLKSEIESLRTEHNMDLAKAAGATQATLDTLDRLYNERETAIAVARHGLVVNEFIYGMALDKSSSSAGALRVDFESRLPDLILACFSAPPEKRTFFRHLIGRLLAWFYCSKSGEMLHRLNMQNSPTWENLAAVQVAASLVRKGNFKQAIVHLELLEHEIASEWIERAKSSMQLWQGAEAAIASMHEDLSRVL